MRGRDFGGRRDRPFREREGRRRFGGFRRRR